MSTLPPTPTLPAVYNLRLKCYVISSILYPGGTQSTARKCVNLMSICLFIWQIRDSLYTGVHQRGQSPQAGDRASGDTFPATEAETRDGDAGQRGVSRLAAAVDGHSNFRSHASFQRMCIPTVLRRQGLSVHGTG